MAQDGQFRPTPKEDALGSEPIPGISEYGQRALSIINGAQRGRERVVDAGGTLDNRGLNFLHHNYTSLHIDQPYIPLLNFGDLDDPEERCEITLLAVSQGAGSTGDGVPISQGEQIVFRKDMAIKLLSQVKPGDTARVEGRARYKVYSETRTPDREISADPKVNFHRSSGIRLILELELSKDSRKVVFRFNQDGEVQELTYQKRGIFGIPGLVSSTSRSGRSTNFFRRGQI